jgi:hypothetical protein
MKMKSKGMVFFKTGAWILLAAGTGHTLLAIPDVFISGPFSPASDEALQALKDTSINFVNWGKGGGTAFYESAWGAYVGFAIGIGLLIALFGLTLLLVLNRDRVLDNRHRSLLFVAIGTSGAMLILSVLFFFYWPALLLVASLVCFILAWINVKKEVSYAAR